MRITHGFTLLEVLFALALTTLAVGGGVAFMLPLASSVPRMAQQAQDDLIAGRILEQIGRELQAEHESMPRRRVSIERKTLTIVTRENGARIERFYHQEARGLVIGQDGGSIRIDSIEDFTASLEADGRVLSVRFVLRARDPGSSATHVHQEYVLR